MAIRIDAEQFPKSISIPHGLITAREPRSLGVTQPRMLVGSTDGIPGIEIQQAHDIAYFTPSHDGELITRLSPDSNEALKGAITKQYMKAGFGATLTHDPDRGIVSVGKRDQQMDVFIGRPLLHTQDVRGIYASPTKRGLAGVLLLLPEWMKIARLSGMVIRDETMNGAIHSSTIGIPGYRLLLNGMLKEGAPEITSARQRWREWLSMFWLDADTLKDPKISDRLRRTVSGLRPFVVRVIAQKE